MSLTRKQKKFFKLSRKADILLKKKEKNYVKFYKNLLNLRKKYKLSLKKSFLYFYNLNKNQNKINLPRLVYKTSNLLTLGKKQTNTPGKRNLKVLFKHKLLNKNTGLKSKISKLKKSLGRTTNGQLVSFYHESGAKKRYRLISNYRLSLIHRGIIEQLEYNPNHSVLLARVYNPILNYHFYIRSPEGLKLGYYIYTNSEDRFNVGDSASLHYLTANKPIHNLNLSNQNNIARAAGMFASIIQKYQNYCLVKFPSKKMYYILTSTQATMGCLGNRQFKLTNLGKAGRSRWLGKRPHVRGVAMNPIDHPHGGGQGKTCGGQPSVSAWGKPTKQIKHRKIFKHSKNKKSVKHLIVNETI